MNSAFLFNKYQKYIFFIFCCWTLPENLAFAWHYNSGETVKKLSLSGIKLKSKFHYYKQEIVKSAIPLALGLRTMSSHTTPSESALTRTFAIVNRKTIVTANFAILDCTSYTRSLSITNIFYAGMIIVKQIKCM